MTRLQGTITGSVAGVGGVALIGACLLLPHGFQICGRGAAPFTSGAALLGALMFSYYFGLPAMILGGSIGATFARGIRGLTISSIMALVAGSGMSIALVIQTIQRNL